MHHGILGMKWGVRRYQNKDGSLTELGKLHSKSVGYYYKGERQKLSKDLEFLKKDEKMQKIVTEMAKLNKEKLSPEENEKYSELWSNAFERCIDAYFDYYHSHPEIEWPKDNQKHFGFFVDEYLGELIESKTSKDVK